MDAYYFAVEAARNIADTKELRQLAEYCLALADDREGDDDYCQPAPTAAGDSAEQSEIAGGIG